MTDLSTVKLYSQSNFNNVTSTDDDKLYFVEDNTQAYVTQTYHNGSSWYRVWSDGFIEQGGIKTDVKATNATQFALNKTMTSSDYIVIVHQKLSSAITSSTNTTHQVSQRFNNTVVAKTTSSFTCQTYSGDSLWYVAGY